MAQWYVQHSGDDPSSPTEIRGPLKPAELLKLVRDGEVLPESLLRKDDSAWFEAREVGGLFEAAMRPTIRYFCPTCDTEIIEPPVKCHKCGAEVQKAREQITENSIASKSEQSFTTQASRSVQKWLKKKAKKRDEEDRG